jgi:lathosterol oxidase
MENFPGIFGGLLGLTLIRYFVLAGIPFLIVYILFSRLFVKGKIQKRYATKKDFLREILHSSSSSLIIGTMATIVLFTPVSNYTQVYKNVNEYPLLWIPLSLVPCLIIHDTYFYWMHRMLHHEAIFRFTHLVHHKSVNPSPWSAYSFHVLEAIAEGGIIIVLALLLPLHPFSFLLFTLTSLIINVYGHLGYEVMPKNFRTSFLFNIINTSVHHNLHHSRFKQNYGLYFRWWDRLMGTENPDYVKEYDRIQQQRFSKTT